MKLNVNLSNLWQSVKNMGAEEVDFDINFNWENSDIKFDDELSRGIEIAIEDLEQNQGLLSVRGRQVVLFIPDHGKSFENAVSDPGKGRRFHIADCKTLDDMRNKKRFERYKVTTDLSGLFPIYGTDGFGQSAEADVALHACKNCLKKLNYKGADNSWTKCAELSASLDLAEFFSTYSSLFRNLPRQMQEKTKAGYTDDWTSVSQQIRKQASYICEECGVDLSSAKRLLHVHHVNGVKSDNSPSNLKPLCADCHRKEPYHEHMHVRHEETVQINHLRREQGLIDQSDWHSVIRNADPAVEGVLSLCQNRGMSPPEVGYEIVDEGGEVIAEVELAWPEHKIAVEIGESEAILGWRVFDLMGALSHFGAKR